MCTLITVVPSSKELEPEQESEIQYESHINIPNSSVILETTSMQEEPSD